MLSGGGAADAVVAALKEWRAIVMRRGGHALIEWAPLAVKAQVQVWDDPGPARADHAGDQGAARPRGILNPGRFVGGI